MLRLGNGKDLLVLPSALIDACFHGIAVFIKHRTGMLRAGKQTRSGSPGIEPVFCSHHYDYGQDCDQRQHVPYVEGILPQIHKQEKRFHQNDKRREDMHQTTALFPHSPADALCHRRKCFKIVIRFKPEGHMRSFPKSCELAGTDLCSARQNAVVLTEISGGCECSFSLVRRGRCLHRPVEKLRIRRRFL